MNWKNLEDELYKAIWRCCETDEDKEAALKYFAGMTVADIIEDALKD